METQPPDGAGLADAIPVELRRLPQWVVWKNENDESGKSTKVPYCTANHRASTKKPEHWRPFV
jgi:primase-polymerase (primpol)-like protein